jgi:hypothetical protein
MTTTLRKAITALTLLVFLQGGDALKGNGLRRQKHVVAANEPRALVDLFAKGLPKNTQKVTKGKNEDLELDDLLPESTTAPKNVTATEDLEQDDLEQDDLEQDDYPATTEIEDVLDAVDDTTTAPRKGGVKGEKSVDPATTPPQISETPEDNNGTSKGKGKGPKGSGENTTDGGEGDDGSDAIDPTIAPEPTIVPSFENGVVVPEPDDSEILPAQVPGGLVTSKLKRVHRSLPLVCTMHLNHCFILQAHLAPLLPPLESSPCLQSDTLSNPMALQIQVTTMNLPLSLPSFWMKSLPSLSKLRLPSMRSQPLIATRFENLSSLSFTSVAISTFPVKSH